jgi:carboxynorspermidine decarboxylase
LNQFPSPAFVVDEKLLIRNLEILDSVQKRTGAHILLALKGFSMHSTFPLVGKYLKGITSSSLNEARLGHDKMGKEVHSYVVAYRDDEFEQFMTYADHLVFNSFSQWAKFKGRVQANPKKISCGIRINPEHSETETPLYDPCYIGSRLGVTEANFKPDELDGIEGLHFHTLCQKGSDALERTFKVVEEKFGAYLHQMKWVNFGGGHHITRPGYDIEKLVALINYVKETYDVQVYLEPGEAVALNTGYLVATVLDLVDNGMNLAILDTSASCHMPDVLEMPYRPEIIGSGVAGEFPYTYRLGGMTCLAGDVIGDYSFPEPLKPGDKLVFTDMAIYSMVKTTTFNGINLPSIVLFNDDVGIKHVKTFGYEDFASRLS